MSCLAFCLSSIYHHEHINQHQHRHSLAAATAVASNTYLHYIILWNGPMGLVHNTSNHSSSQSVCFDNQCKYNRQTLALTHTHTQTQCNKSKSFKRENAIFRCNICTMIATYNYAKVSLDNFDCHSNRQKKTGLSWPASFYLFACWNVFFSSLDDNLLCALSLYVCSLEFDYHIFQFFFSLPCFQLKKEKNNWNYFAIPKTC